MASKIRIKRSEVAGNPTVLSAGELAYSGLADNGSNGGDRLYIGIGTETAGDAANHFVIGGKFFTDRLDHTAGTLTASSAIVVDSDSKINVLNVDNLRLDGNILSSTDTNGDINLTPNGTGKTVVTNLHIGADSITEFIQDITGGQIISGNGVDVTYNDGAGTSTLSLNTEFTQDLVGAMVSGTGADQTNITVTYDDESGKLDFSVATATTSVLGVASFSSNSFDVTAGAVTIKAAGVSNNQLANSAVTIGSTSVSLGATVTAFAGLTQLDVDNVRIDGNTVSTTDTNGNLVLNPNGTGRVSIANAYTLPRVDGTAGQVLVTDGVGAVTFQSPSSNSFTIAGNTGTDTFSTGQTLTFTGTAPIVTAVTDNTVTISASDATTTAKGVASFADANFTVTTGAVTAKNITLGSSTLTLGSTTNTLAGLQQLDVDNIRINGNEISSTDTNGDISLNPNGTGVVAVNTARITGVADPVDPQDAATKAYVDARAAGLDPKQSVRAATTGPITLSNTQTIDGVALAVGNRVLVKNQADNTQNGIYVVADGAWSRAADMDEPAELTAGLFFFVEQGTANGDAGFVKTSDSVGTVGSDPITFVQFSGAGQIVAGDGLSKTGNQLDVVVAATGGIEISADALQLKSTVAGDGLTYNSGVIAVGGTADRISVTADAVDIAATYVGQSSITTLGTIATGVWQGTVIGPTYGGTGVNNGTKTITLGGNFTHTGAHTLGVTTTANTSVTLPTTGTLATLAGEETLTNKTITGATISTGSINNTPIGASTRNTGAFTTLAADGAVTFTAGTGSTSSTSGTLVVTGGVGISQHLFGSGAATSNLSGFNIDGGTY